MYFPLILWGYYFHLYMSLFYILTGTFKSIWAKKLDLILRVGKERVNLGGSIGREKVGECDQKALYRDPQPKQAELGDPHRRWGGWNARDRGRGHHKNMVHRINEAWLTGAHRD